MPRKHSGSPSRCRRPHILPVVGDHGPAGTSPFESGGAGHGRHHCGDYLRFAQMLLNGGELDGTRISQRQNRRLDDVGPLSARAALRATTILIPGNGYGFGLGFAVRTGCPAAEWPGSVGEYCWDGYAGTLLLDRSQGRHGGDLHGADAVATRTNPERPEKTGLWRFRELIASRY